MRPGREFALFAIGGVIGLVVSAGSIQLMVSLLDMNPYLAWLFAFLLAATATWWWNRRHTFAARSSGRSLLGEWAHWIVLMGFGALVNYGVFILCLMLFPSWHRWPSLAVAAGSVVAAGVNFLSARLMLFRRSKTVV